MKINETAAYAHISKVAVTHQTAQRHTKEEGGKLNG